MNKEEIKGLRVELRITQEELARKIGVSLNAVRTWESGMHSPYMRNVKKLESLKQNN
jgi:DNA-binding transcriptional regulator YiaG